MSTKMMPPQVVLADPAFEALRKEILGVTGLNYYEKQPEELARRIAQRLSALNVHKVDAYVQRLSDLATKGAEWDSLIAELTVGETFFFRHREQFDALKEHVFPALIERNRPLAKLRIWSAGCASGAEAYSVAILLAREFNAQLAGWDVSILGTDINRQYLLRAQLAAFSDWELRSVAAEMRESCFWQEGGSWVLRPYFRRGVSFEFHNLIQPAQFMGPGSSSNFDLILCRNVMIYFEPAVARQLIGQFHKCLNEGGWLLVGYGESNVEFFRSFRTVNVPGAVVYNKIEASAAPESPWQPDPTFDLLPGPAATEKVRRFRR